jgi:hypothetical protein
MRFVTWGLMCQFPLVARPFDCTFAFHSFQKRSELVLRLTFVVRKEAREHGVDSVHRRWTQIRKLVQTLPIDQGMNRGTTDEAGK